MKMKENMLDYFCVEIGLPLLGFVPPLIFEVLILVVILNIGELSTLRYSMCECLDSV